MTLKQATALLWLLGGCQAIAGIEERRLVADLDGGETEDAGEDADTLEDGGDDAGKDAAMDPDAGPDAGKDSGQDAGQDAGKDAGGDAATDSGPADSGSDAHSGDAGKDADVDAGQTECDLYCDAVMTACVNTYAVYASREVCMATCATLPQDEGADNSLACRMMSAENALRAEPEVNCPLAGPGGGNGCGTNCQSYCLMRASICADPLELADCESACLGVRDLDKETKTNFADSTFDTVAHRVGELLQCRLIQLSAAALDSEQCEKSSLAPRQLSNGAAHPCSYQPGQPPRCEDYCRLNRMVCTGDALQYESESQCLKACELIPPGTGQASGGQDSVGGRMSHPYNAVDSGGPGTHCPHAGPAGDAACGAPAKACLPYCRTVEAACPTEFATQFGDRATCLAQCDTLEDLNYTVSTGMAGGATVPCRLLHALRAQDGNASACAAAMGAGACAP